MTTMDPPVWEGILDEDQTPPIMVDGGDPQGSTEHVQMVLGGGDHTD